MIIVWTHVIYLAISIAVTVIIGQVLFRNGRIFLVDTFHGREALADSVNRLLLAGFYLVNIGFVSLAVKYGGRPAAVPDALEYLSTKIGGVLVLLGVLHLLNVYVFSRIRRSAITAAPYPYNVGGESDYLTPRTTA